MPMHNLIEYSDNCSKTSQSLQQHYKDEPALNTAGTIIFASNGNALFNFKQINNSSNRK